jgi:hypothetical protein
MNAIETSAELAASRVLTPCASNYYDRHLLNSKEAIKNDHMPNNPIPPQETRKGAFTREIRAFLKR